MRDGADEAGPSRSMSPLPMSRSAPCWSRMTRLSVALDTAKASRAGTLALMTPVMTFTDGRCVAITRWMPTARAIWAMRQIESSTSRAATIIRSASSSITIEDERQARELAGDLAARRHLVGEVAAVVGGVVAGDVAEADLGEQVVAPLHLAHRPRQRVGRLLGVGDHLGEQVRQPVVLAHLDPLGVDEDHAHLVGRRPHEDRRDERVEAARLARTGGAGDEEVGHRRQVHQHGLAVDVPADGHLEGVAGPLGLRRDEDVAEGDDLAVAVGHLDADGLPAGDRRQDADVGRGHRVGDVLVEAGDAGDLDARAELELVAGDRRARPPCRRAWSRRRAGPGPARGCDPAALDGGLVDLVGVGSCAGGRAAAASRASPSPPGRARSRAGWPRRARRARARAPSACAGRACGAAGRRRGRRGRCRSSASWSKKWSAAVRRSLGARAQGEEVGADAPERCRRWPRRRAGWRRRCVSAATRTGTRVSTTRPADADRREDQAGAPRREPGRQRTGGGHAEQAAGGDEVVGGRVEARPSAGQVEQAAAGDGDHQAADPEVGARRGVEVGLVAVGLGIAPHQDHARSRSARPARAGGPTRRSGRCRCRGPDRPGRPTSA